MCKLKRIKQLNVASFFLTQILYIILRHFQLSSIQTFPHIREYYINNLFIFYYLLAAFPSYVQDLHVAFQEVWLVGQNDG